MPEENKSSSLEDSLQNLSSSLIDNDAIKTAISELNGTVETRFDQIEEKLDGDPFDFGDRSTNTFEPIKTVQDVSTSSGENLLDENTLNKESVPNVVNITNEIDATENVEPEAEEVLFNSPDTAPEAEDNSVEAPVLPEIILNSDNTDTVNAISELANTLTPAPGEQAPDENTPQQIIVDNVVEKLDEIKTEIVPVANDAIQEVNTNTIDDRTNIENVTNAPETSNTTLSQIVNTETPRGGDEVTNNITNNNPVEVALGNSIIDEQSPLDTLSEIVEPASASAVTYNINTIEGVPDEANPLFSDINLNYTGIDEKTRIVELASEIEQSKDEQKIAELNSIKEGISKRENTESIFSSDNFKEAGEVQGSLDRAPVIRVENNQEIKATLGDDATELFGKMVRQLTKLNRKFDEAFGEQR